MEPFLRIEGIAAPLHRPNIDTDAIIPSREITSPEREGYGEKLFAPWRYLGPDRRENPDFVLNRAPFRAAPILIAGDNFGCGSSREMAVWALRQFGIRVVVAPSFGAIFRSNCLRNGILPVVLPAATVAALAGRAEAGDLVLAVDLGRCLVTTPDGSAHEFAVEAREREMMLEGLDDIDLTLSRAGEIEAFQARDRVARPWIWSVAP
ncbi:MAG: 3-isopropylmalate dehydratase small subunit [Betaproteobacteria bacterium]|nr:3-isopropylmalate dehydratase small subunit [Betaproteobacteria bacterium]